MSRESLEEKVSNEGREKYNLCEFRVPTVSPSNYFYRTCFGNHSPKSMT